MRGAGTRDLQGRKAGQFNQTRLNNGAFENHQRKHRQPFGFVSVDHLDIPALMQHHFATETRHISFGRIGSGQFHRKACAVGLQHSINLLRCKLRPIGLHHTAETRQVVIAGLHGPDFVAARRKGAAL